MVSFFRKEPWPHQEKLGAAPAIREFVDVLQSHSCFISSDFKESWPKVLPEEGPVLAAYPVRFEAFYGYTMAVCWVLTTKSLNLLEITAREFRVKSYQLERYLCTDISLSLQAEKDRSTFIIKTLSRKRYHSNWFQFEEPAQHRYWRDYRHFIDQL